MVQWVNLVHRAYRGRLDAQLLEVILVRVVHQDHQVCQDHQEKRVKKETTVLMVSLVGRVETVNPVTQAAMVLTATLVTVGH